MAKRRAVKPKIDFTDQEKEEIFKQLNSSITSSQLERGKTISISDLPDCQHKTRLMNITEKPDMAKICIVAIRSNDKKSWQAYAGYPGVDDLTDKAKEVDQPFLMPLDFVWLCENVHDVEQTRFMGELLPQEVAIELFPDWKELEYKQ